MDKYQVRSCLSASGSITYDPLTGVIGGGGGGGATWGSITGTLSSQTDLQTALDAKQNESIVINSNTTAVLDGVYTVVASATFTDPTPAEGKGFMVFVRNGTATVGGTGYSTAGTIINRIYHSGAWANYTLAPTSLAIGTTPITGGTVGRVLFEGTGNVLQQAANLFYDNTNSRLSLGMGASPGARVDVLSPGTTSSDIGLRIRNNGNTVNLFEVLGTGDVSILNNAGTTRVKIQAHPSLSNHFVIANSNNPWFDTGTGVAVQNGQIDLRISGHAETFRFYGLGSAPFTSWGFKSQGTPSRLMLGVAAAESFTFFPTNFGLGNIVAFGTSATRTFGIQNGVAPTTGLSGGDGFQLYSADIVAGNAAPHFRSEAGDIIKLYKTNTYTQTYNTASRTVNAYTPDTESVAYTGIDNLQLGTVYAQVSDLNTLRVAYENLRTSYDNLIQVVTALIDDGQSTGLIA